MEIDKIKIGKRHRKDIGNIGSLKNSIAKIGLLHPVVIDEKNNLIAGVRRIEAFKQLGKKEIPVNITNIKNILQGERDENVIRKDFTPSEDVSIWQAMEKIQGERTDLKLHSDSERSQPIKRASKILGMSTDTLSKAKQVIDFGDKELIAKMDRTGNVNKAYRIIKQKKDEQKILKDQTKLTAEGRFKTILIDPPWQYDTNLIGRTQPTYKTWSIEELEKLEIPFDINCHLYLWTTNAFLPKALQLGKHWKFDYKTCITWIKPSIGMGAYFRNSTEHCLFFLKGNLSTRIKNIPTHFEAKRLEHSEKPEKIFNIIEKASYPPYIEIFGRKLRKGWKICGNLE